MNRKLFERNFEILNKILDDNEDYLGRREVRYRKRKLRTVFTSMMNEDVIKDEYYSLAHEIRSIEMFKTFGEIKVAMDSRAKPGVDLNYRNYLVECVIATAGTGRNFKLLKDSGYQVYNKLIDYKSKFNQISLRILSSLYSKREKYYNDLEKGVINKDKPFCIFLNFGSLSQEWFPGDYCKDANRFLIGRGDLMIVLNKRSGELIECKYGYEPYINNNNQKPVCKNFFGEVESNCVSMVIITIAELNEEYSPKNTFLFLNPNADNKVNLKDFKDFPYWKIWKDNEYVLRKNGKRILIKE